MSYQDSGKSLDEAASEIVDALYSNLNPDERIERNLLAQSYLKAKQRGFETASRDYLHQLLKESNRKGSVSSFDELAGYLPDYVSSDELQAIKKDIEEGSIEF